MIFLDTNYFLRYLLNDISPQHLEAKNLFEKGAKGNVLLFTSTIVFFEIFWVLTTSYKKSKKEIIDILNNLLALPFIEVEERQILQDALSNYQNSNLEFEDCYNIAYAKNNNMLSFATFDKKLKNFLR